MNSSNTRPFSIRIFLPDGEPDGVRVIEKSNWTGTGLVVPRSLFKESKKRDEFSRTGVYVLVGTDNETELPTIYIGQGDPVRTRLENHFSNKDFWTWSVFFVTRDDSLNKAHIGYLESALLSLAAEAKRSKRDNNNIPQPSPLSEADTADMNSFLDDILSILPLVGLNVFERPRAKAVEKAQLYLKGKGISAEGYESAQGFVVQSGSTAVLEEAKTIQSFQSALRSQLQGQGVLVREGSFLKLNQDYVFGSSSTAASVLLGRSASGPGYWRDSEGTTLRELQQAEISDNGE